MSSNQNNPTGGVRNLRALFENKGSDLSTSPPSRGRSPSNTDTSSHSRPVSKVRASFVAVERPGELGQPPQIGLRKTSDVNVMEEVKENGTTAPKSTEVTPTNGQQSDAQDAAKENFVPSHARNVTNTSVEGGLGSILKGSAFEGPPKADAILGMEKANEVKEGSSSGAEARGNKTSNGPRMPPGSSVTRAKKGLEKTLLPHQSPPIVTNAGRSQEPKTVSDVRKKLSPHSPNDSKGSKTPTTASTATTSKPSPTIKSAGQKSSPIKTTAPPSAIPPTALPSKEKTDTQRNKNQTTKLLTTVKPKTTSNGPKSPPMTTASSTTAASKFGGASINGNTTKPNGVGNAEATVAHQREIVTKQLTTTARPPRASLAPTSTSAVKKPPRASLPVHTKPVERPTSRVSTGPKAPSEDFLARMMRPTASSAQKAHDKVQPQSPPRAKKEAPATKRDRRSSTSIGTQTEEDKENQEGTAPIEQSDNVGKEVAPEPVLEETQVAQDAA